MKARSFLLYVLPRPDGSYGVELRQRVNGARHLEERAVVRVWDAPLQAALTHVLEALRRSGYRPSELRRGRRDPFELREEAGVRLGLVFLALKPLRKTTRMERIAGAIHEMSDEEVYYWFSKALSARSAQRAVRVLLGGE
ncbi:MAG TPA: hypothetical protein DHW14_02310 [Clostridiales bacterium]|nr:hypothetical protein [Clostridiales bacterium]